MKRVEFNKIGSKDVLNIIEREIPTPRENEVLVQIKSAGINRAEELFFQGQYLFQPQFPSTIGIEASGIIESVGSKVTLFSKGDEVCLTPNVNISEYGFIGEYAVAPESAVVKKPKDLNFIQASSVWMTYGTAFAALVLRGGLKKGANQTVLISASSSGVGTAAIQVAKSYGATVIATTRTNAKKQFLLDLGADYVLATEKDEKWTYIVKEITDGKGFDIAIDAIASSSFNESLIEVAGFEAKIAVYGALALEPNPKVLLFPMLMKGITIEHLHYVFHVLEVKHRFDQMKNDVLKGLESGDYKPVIDKVFSLKEAPEAYGYMASNQQIGKIVIEM